MFVEVKIYCGCGARYKFDVEPLNGRMPAKVSCPVCGVDGTEAGNTILREKLAPVAPPAPAPTTDVEVIPPPRSMLPPPMALVTSNPTTSQASSDPAITRLGTSPFGSRPQLVPGIAGAILSASIGGSAWFALLAFTGFELGFAAWGVGMLTGFVTRLLGRRGSLVLGAIAAVCTLVAVAAGQWLAGLQGGGALPLWTIATQSFGWLSGLWLVLASASAFRLASR